MTNLGMRIGELAHRAGINPRTLRYYERIGLLAPSARTEAGYRLYSDKDADRLAFIRRAQTLGLSLAEIADIIALRDSGTPPCRDVHAVVEILRCAMLDVREYGAESRGIAFGFVGGHPCWPHTRLIDRVLKECLRCPGIAALRKVSVNHLPILVNRAIDVGPLPVQTGVRFIDAPLHANRSTMRTGSFPKQREEPLDPAVDRAAVDDEASLYEPLDHIGVAQAEANVPADRQGDHVVRKSIVRESTR